MVFEPDYAAAMKRFKIQEEKRMSGGRMGSRETVTPIMWVVRRTKGTPGRAARR